MMDKDKLPHEKLIYEYVNTIEHLEKQNKDNPLFSSEIQRLKLRLEELKEQIYGNLNSWERVQICRHPGRPHSIDYILKLCDGHFKELSGDRSFGDDNAVIGGLGYIDGQKCVIIGQEKGKDTESRIQRNFGYLHPEGFRKALRLMKLAEKFNLPVVSLVDTAGAYPGLEAEERGQGWAIAYNLREMARLKTPVIVVIIGEGSSGGALGVAVGDVVGMLEHAYYSVISPEGCASILWKDPGKNIEAAEALKLNAEYLLEHNLIDYIIQEPLGGAHHDKELMYSRVKNFILEKIEILKNIPKELLIEQRYLKFRALGEFEEKTFEEVEAEMMMIKEKKEAAAKENQENSDS